MQILKHGILVQRKFACQVCKCEFVADPDEYTATMVNRKILWYSSECPECGVISNTSEIWDCDMGEMKFDEA